MWNLPRPGIEPIFPAWAGGALSTVPPGKSLNWVLKDKLVFWRQERVGEGKARPGRERSQELTQRRRSA